MCIAAKDQVLAPSHFEELTACITFSICVSRIQIKADLKKGFAIPSDWAVR